MHVNSELLAQQTAVAEHLRGADRLTEISNRLAVVEARLKRLERAQLPKESAGEFRQRVLAAIIGPGS